MAKGKINYLSMSPADNGIIVSWSEKVEKKGSNTFDNCSYTEHSLVFDEDEGENALDEAFAKYRELWERRRSES